MWLKAMAGHAVMERDLDSKGRTRRKLLRRKLNKIKNHLVARITSPITSVAVVSISDSMVHFDRSVANFSYHRVLKQSYLSTVEYATKNQYQILEHYQVQKYF